MPAARDAIAVLRGEVRPEPVNPAKVLASHARVPHLVAAPHLDPGLEHDLRAHDHGSP